MAKTYGNNLNLNVNELQNAKIQNLPSAPTFSALDKGRIYYDTNSNTIQYNNGTTWGPIGSTVSPATTVTAMNAFGLSSVIGSLTTYAREDHRHSTPTAPTAASVNAVGNAGGITSAQVGTASVRAGLSGQVAGNLFIDNDDFLLWVATGATTFTQLAAFGSSGATINATAGTGGAATTYSRSDHAHSITTATAGASAVTDTASAGSGTSMALANHVHGREGFGAPTTVNTYGQSAVTGSAATVSHSDHTHGSPALPTAANVGAVANNGGAPGLAVGLNSALPTSGQTAGNLYVASDLGLAYVFTSATASQQIAPLSNTNAVAVGTAASGSATTYSRQDHVHGFTTGTSSTSAVGDSAATGSGTALALANHTHGREAFATTITAETYGASSNGGAASTVARGDHVHGMPAAPTVSSIGAVANNGNAPYLQTGTGASRPNTGLTVGGVYVDNDDFLAYIATSTTVYTQIAPFALTAAITSVTVAATAAQGTASSYARGDHTHGVGTPSAATTSAVADSAGAGSSGTPARSDHVHGREAFGTTISTITYGASSNGGAATTPARSDHTHGTPAAPTATSVGAVANNGAAPGLQTGSAASRPASGQTTGNLYFDNDDGLIFIATGASTFAQMAPFAGTGIILATSGSTIAGGSALTYARGDHQHGLGTAVAPAASAVTDTVVTGSSAIAARADHVHAREGFGAVVAQQSFAASFGNGSLATVSRSDHTHGTPTHDAAAHSAIPISALATATAIINMGGFRVTNAGDPSGAQDLVTKNYADNLRAGLSVKDPVNAASTANVPVSTGLVAGQTIDGVTVVTGGRYLLKNQSTASENGIYIGVASGAGTRATDADGSGEIVTGSAVWVQGGTTNANQRWTVTATSATPWVPGSSTSTWTMDFAATSVTAGAGLTAAGGVLNVGAGTGMTINADDIAINTSVVVRKYAQAIGDGTTTVFVVTHSLGTQDVTIGIYTNSGVFDEIETDVEHTSTNTITIRFSVAPTTNQYRVVVHG